MVMLRSTKKNLFAVGFCVCWYRTTGNLANDQLLLGHLRLQLGILSGVPDVQGLFR